MNEREEGLLNDGLKKKPWHEWNFVFRWLEGETKSGSVDLHA